MYKILPENAHGSGSLIIAPQILLNFEDWIYHSWFLDIVIFSPSPSSFWSSPPSPSLSHSARPLSTCPSPSFSSPFPVSSSPSTFPLVPYVTPFPSLLAPTLSHHRSPPLSLHLHLTLRLESLQNSFQYDGQMEAKYMPYIIRPNVPIPQYTIHMPS